MNSVNLSEMKWEITQLEQCADYLMPDCDGQWLAASVPGAVHYDLVKAGKLVNPYSSTKAAFDSRWVMQNDWLYKTEFDTPQNINAMKYIILRFDGIDTYSEIWLNGKMAGITANAYRTYDFPVEPALFRTDKKNILCVRIKSHERMISSKIDETEKHLNNGRSVEGTLGKSLIRRYQRSFFAGSSLLNLGTGVLGMGIVRSVNLIMYCGAYIADCCLRTVSAVCENKSNNKNNNYAECKILLSVKNPPESGAVSSAKISVTSPDNKNVFYAEIPVESEYMEIPLVIENPLFWWPRFYGDPNLYLLNVKIFQDGKLTDEINQRTGIKSSELVTHDENRRNTFYFKINGRKVFVHGQNHIPLDYIKSYRSKEEYLRIFEMLENQYVNMIRIWGGGVVEDDFFYEECDKRGIMLFQDFYLHSNQYPDYDNEWVDEFLSESNELLKKIRVHPSLCVICGGNETREGWDCWGWKQSSDRFYGERLITEDLREISASLCPELPYIVNSPHGGKNCQSPVEGESHIWGNFFNSAKDPLFVTETCWTQESYSRPETLNKIMDINVDEYAGKNWAEKWKETTSLGLLNRYPYSDWFESSSLRAYLHSLEIEQMRADYNALNMLRFNSPNNNGIIYWSFNKGGPLFQFGCVDYCGYPMMSYYAVKRAFAPVSVFARRDISDISVMLSNHGSESGKINVQVFHLNKEGKELGYWAKEVSTAKAVSTAETSHCDSEKPMEILRLCGLYDKVQDRTEEIVYVCAQLKQCATKAACACFDDLLLADDMLFFCSYAEFSGIYSPLSVKIDKNGENRWLISISADVPIRMVEIESNQKLLFSDNYFPIIPQKHKIITANLLEKTSPEAASLTINILGNKEKKAKFSLT